MKPVDIKGFEGLYMVTEGVKHTVTGLNMFCREHNLQQAHMCNLAKGKLKQHKGWTTEKSDTV